MAHHDGQRLRSVGGANERNKNERKLNSNNIETNEGWNPAEGEGKKQTGGGGGVK
jgi:hypothetical protein